ncbi:MAG: TetR/AcrR family transcriptional regulator [Polyangiales bacterium]
MGRPKEHGAETRARLIAAAGEILSEEGPEALSIRRLADRIGTTTRAVYSVFGGKDGLISAMYLEMADALAERHFAVPHDEDPIAELLLLAHAYRDAALEHPHLYPLVVGRPVPGFTPLPEAKARARSGLVRVHEAIERAIAQKRIVGRTRDDVVSEVWALLHGLATLEIAGAIGPRARARSLWNDSVSAILIGLASRPAREPPVRPARKRAP